MEKLIRCSIVGLEDGETITATLNGVEVTFSAESAQHDIPAVPVEPAPKSGGKHDDKNR